MAVPATIIFVALRIALPLFLAIDVLFWYTASSLVKVMLFLILSHVRLPVTNTKQGCTSIFLMTVLVVNCLMFVSRLAAYIVFSIIELPVNSTIGIVLDLLGMSTYSLDLWEQVLHIMLEILIICTVIIVLIELHQLPTTHVNALTSSQIKTRRRLFFVGKCMLAISLCLTAIQLPSVLNAVYYVAFVVVMTIWFGCKQRRIHPCALYGLCGFIMVHIMLVLVAQILYRFELVVSTFANWCRYLGIVEMVKHGSLQPYRQSLVNLRVCTGPNQLMKTFRQGFVNLLFLMWLNYLLGTMMFFFSKPEIFNRKEPEDSPQKKITKPHEIKISHRATSAEFMSDVRVLQEEFSLRRRASVVSGMEGVSRFLSSSALNKILDDYKKEKKEVEDKEKDNKEWHNFWLDTLTLLKKMSFMSAHVAMLAWSIHFYSWLAGGMLFWFFIVGMLPNTRAVTETFAPVILFYAIFLIAVDYFYSMDLTEQERPESPVLRVIGFRKPRRLVWSLLFKNVYTLFFWLLLYHWTGCPKKHDIFSSPDHGTEYKSCVGVWLSQRMSPFISRFWIWLVMTVLLLYGFNALSHDDFIQLEQIFFLFLLVTSMIVMQISFHAWCRMLVVLWILVLFSCFMILVPLYISKLIGINPAFLMDFGWNTLDRTELGLELFCLIVVMVIVRIQFHYVHYRFLALVKLKRDSTFKQEDVEIDVEDPMSPDSNVKQEDVETDVEKSLNPKSSKDSANQAFQIATERFLVFLDLNLNTFLLLCLLVLFVSRICAVNLVLLVLVVISLMFGRTGFKITMHLVMIIISIIIVLTAVYQLNFFHHQQYNTTCLVNATVSNSAEWLGFYKKTGCLTLFPLLYLHILAMILATMKAVVSARLMYKHCQTASTPYVEAQMTFPDIKRSDADISIPNCMKYLLNYGFYMFGTEICLSLMSVMVALSLNCMGPLYLLWLWTLTFHQQSRWLWVTYQLFISAIVILQYAALVGLLPSLCRPLEYPWKGSLLLYLLGKCFLLLNEKQTTQINMFISDEMIRELVVACRGKTVLCYNCTYWGALLLAADKSPLVMAGIISSAPNFNFIMLMAVSRLNFCIRQEKKWIGEYPGGTNKDITEELENKNFVNPVPDHTSHMIAWLDVTKNALFHMHLLLLLLLFFTSGLLQFTPFTPVYLIIAFHNFQKGYTVYLYPLRHIQKRWNKIIIILLLIITCKIMIRIFLMIFSEFPYHYCSFLQNLQHISRNYEFEVSSMNITINGTTTIVKKCSLKLGYNTVFWDSSIYMILLLLKRFCRSCYVLHHIMDSKALLCLSSRGLELMEQMWIQRQHETKVKEEKHLLKIRIASQQARRLQKQEYHNMLTHIDAVRSGDYTLFDFMNVDEEELPEKEETEEKLEEILDSNRATLGTFLEMACEKGTCRAAKLYLKMQDFTFKQKEEGKEVKEGKKKKRFFIRIFRRMWFGIIITWAFLTASVESVILFLNTITYTYLKIRVTMLQERRLLKQLPDFQQQGSITGHNTPWRPMQSKINVNQQRIEEMKDTASDHQIREEHIKHMSSQIMLVRLIMALLNVFLAYSDLICYLMIFVYHMVCASLMTLPLPFLVLMWGALARPRPTETFWTVLTTYAEILLIFDWVLKFDFMPMKKENPTMKTFYPSRIVGMQIKDSQVYDLLLLCSIYFHHHMRNILGMRRAEGEVVSLSEEKFILDSEGLREATDDVEIPKYYTTRQLQTTSSQIVLVHTEEHGAVDRKLFTKLIFQEYCKPVTSFFFSLLHNDQNSIFDMYVLMFLCDLCIFLIYIIEYNSFGQDVAGSSSMNILKSNSVPVNMVFLLFSHFLLILIERMLYLQRKMIYTILFHLLQVLMWHVWLFFILPSMTDERYQQHFPRQACYLLKCFYFLLGTYQIRNGPPSRILSNCVCKHYTMLNKVLHQAYLQIPFLYEMRTLTDWIWTDTSFTLYEWLKFEDIFANVFQRKCSQDFEVKYSKNRGTKTKKWVKYSVGISLVFVIIVLLWFPVTMYAFIRLGTKSHLPLQVTLTMRMGSHANLYRSCATGSNIMPMDPYHWSLLPRLYRKNLTTKAFLNTFRREDVTVSELTPYSEQEWLITPPDLQKLKEHLKTGEEIEITFQLEIMRHEVESYGDLRTTYVLSRYDLKQKDQEMILLLLMNNSALPVVLPYVLPKFIYVMNSGKVEVIYYFMDGMGIEKSHRSVKMNHHDEDGRQWWGLHEDCNDHNYHKFLKHWYEASSDKITIIIFNEGAIPDIISLFSQSGTMVSISILIILSFCPTVRHKLRMIRMLIETMVLEKDKIIGLYLGFVYLCFRGFRFMLGNLSRKIVYTDMPYVDRILQLCQDLYLVRERREYDLEEQLYAKLLFLYRSPETIIRYTQYPQHWRQDKQTS